MSLHIVSGRGFTAQDRVPPGRATLANETLAQFFQRDAVGKRTAQDADAVTSKEAFVIVGVAACARPSGTVAIGGQIGLPLTYLVPAVCRVYCWALTLWISLPTRHESCSFLAVLAADCPARRAS